MIKDIMNANEGVTPNNREMDVLKAKHDGDSQAWALNAKINELETNKKIR